MTVAQLKRVSCQEPVRFCRSHRRWRSATTAICARRFLERSSVQASAIAAKCFSTVLIERPTSDAIWASVSPSATSSATRRKAGDRSSSERAGRMCPFVCLLN